MEHERSIRKDINSEAGEWADNLQKLNSENYWRAGICLFDKLDAHQPFSRFFLSKDSKKDSKSDGKV